MQYRKLGRTGLEVSEIGYGAWGIGAKMWQGAKDDESIKALNVALDRGVNFIDTALAYGDGHSERLVGQVVRRREERIFVATKIPPKNEIWPARGSLEEVFPSAYIVRCVDQSLANLDLERIDLLQLHVWNPEWFGQDEWHRTLEKLKDAGKLAFFGISINDHDPESALEVVASGQIDTVQVIYNIFDQSPEDRLFPLCREKDVGVIVRVPFDEGALTGKIGPETEFPEGDWRNAYFKGDRKKQVQEHVEELKQYVDGEVASLPELALRFCLQPEAVSTVIPGMRSVEHARANTAVSDKPPLSDELREKLKGHRWLRNFYPEA